MSRPVKGDLRAWWIPQVPMAAFNVDVPDFKSASLILDTLADYDRFQFENNIKPDYCNVGGLSEFDGTDWFDWEDPETGDNFDALRHEPDWLAEIDAHYQSARATASVGGAA